MTRVVGQYQGRHGRNYGENSIPSLFILYDNINFYEHIRDQRLYKWSAIVNYTARYICFMKTPEEGREDNTWFEHYIDSTEINQRLVNIVVNEDFDLTQTDHIHQPAANQYIFFEVLGQYFSRSIHK